MLWASLHAIDPMERAVLTLYANGKSHREIAQIMGWRSHRAAGYWVKKARAHLAAKLPEVEAWLGR